MTETSRLNELEAYLPSSSEKKQAVMMYMLVGLVLSLNKLEVSPYTHHHIKQSLGWVVFLAFIIFSDFILLFLGLFTVLFSWLAALITFPTLTVGIWGIYQAQQGKYIWESESVNRFFLMFSGVGNWTLNLFDANHFQIIDANMYRSEEQFYTNSTQTEPQIQSDQANVMVGQTQIIPDAVDLNTLQGGQNTQYTISENSGEILTNQDPQIYGNNGIQMDIQSDIQLDIQTNTQINNQVIVTDNSGINLSQDNAKIDTQGEVIGDANSLDNNLQIPINNGNIGVDLNDSASINSPTQVQN